MPIRPHLTYANVMATIAVFVALGGGAYAAIKLPKNSVGTAQLKKNAVTGAKVKDGSLIAKDFKAGQLPVGAQGAKGDKGDPGAPGAPGTAGTAGTNGTNGTDGLAGKDGANAATNVVVHRVIQGVVAATPGTATVNCANGEHLVSGGGGWVNNISEDLDNLRTVTTISYNGP